MSDSNIQKESLIFAGKQPEEHYHVRLQTGVYIVQNTMARGGGNGAGEKNEKWGSGEQNEKEGKRGKEKEEKEKGERDFFVNIMHTTVDHRNTLKSHKRKI